MILTTIESDESPFVHVGAERVGVLVDLVETERLPLLGKSVRDAGPGGVDVKERSRVVLN